MLGFGVGVLALVFGVVALSQSAAGVDTAAKYWGKVTGGLATTECELL